MIYRSGQYLRPHQVRTKRFARRWRGLDPTEVYAYLNGLADELDQLLRAESIARSEADRIRQGLRQWQSRHAHSAYHDPDRPTPTNRGHW